MLFLSAFVVVTAYLSATSFATGSLNYGLYYAVCSAIFFWIWLPHICQNWFQIGLILNTPGCDYLAMDRQLTSATNLFEALRCPTRRLLYPELALLKMYQGLYAEAESWMRKALDDIAKSRFSKLPQFAIHECTLATIYAREQRFDEADNELEKAFKRVYTSYRGAEMFMMFPLAVRASLKLQKEDLQGANEDVGNLLRAIERYEPARGLWKTYAPRLKCSCYLVGAIVYLKLNQQEKSDKFVETFFNTIAENGVAISPVSVKWINMLAEQYLQIRRYETAEDLLDVSYDLLRQVPNHPDCQPTLASYKQLLLDTGREKEVADMLAWVKPQRKDLPASTT